MRLNPVDKKKWVDALRSGKYKQCEKYLNRDDKFCCLGVAKDLGLANRIHTDELLEYTFLPEIIQSELASMNDGNGRKQRNFIEIADWIDQNL